MVSLNPRNPIMEVVLLFPIYRFKITKVKWLFKSHTAGK